MLPVLITKPLDFYRANYHKGCVRRKSLRTQQKKSECIYSQLQEGLLTHDAPELQVINPLAAEGTAYGEQARENAISE